MILCFYIDREGKRAGQVIWDAKHLERICQGRQDTYKCCAIHRFNSFNTPHSKPLKGILRCMTYTKKQAQVRLDETHLRTTEKPT